MFVRILKQDDSFSKYISRMGDCQLDDLLDMLEEDDDAFEEAAVDDPGPCEDPDSVDDHGEEEEEAEDDVEEEVDLPDLGLQSEENMEDPDDERLIQEQLGLSLPDWSTDQLAKVTKLDIVPGNFTV